MYSFTFQTCCSLESVVKAGSSSGWGVQLHYKLEAETFQEGRKFSRVWFGPDHTIKSHITENTISVDHNENITCQKHIAYIKVNIITQLIYNNLMLLYFVFRKTLWISSLQ